MSKTYILYNPLANNSCCQSDIERLAQNYEEPVLTDVRTFDSFAEFMSGLSAEEDVVLCGGDGTLNRFANDMRGKEIPNRIYFYSIGTGNDFVRDLGKERGCTPDFEVNKYLKDLPTVYVNGREMLFINGIGYGIDGYCCEEGDRQRAKNPAKAINYTAIAIKGLLFHYNPTNAVVTIDGVRRTYKKVWLAPTMNGRFFGGGVMPTPAQDRLNEERTLSFMMYTGSRLKALMLFPTMFKGKHIKHTKCVSILTGKEITVEFDRPTPLQVDGETILDVSSYTVRSAAL